MMNVTFCGHGIIDYSLETKKLMLNSIELLIENGAEKFFLGGYGKFDILSAQSVFELKQKYPHIISVLVIPYLNRKYNTDLYDYTLYPPLEKIPLKYAISKRNEWMVDNSDVIIAYTAYSFGGAVNTLNYAIRKKKQIIQLYDE